MVRRNEKLNHSIRRRSKAFGTKSSSTPTTSVIEMQSEKNLKLDTRPLLPSAFWNSCGQAANARWSFSARSPDDAFNYWTRRGRLISSDILEWFAGQSAIFLLSLLNASDTYMQIISSVILRFASLFTSSPFSRRSLSHIFNLIFQVGRPEKVPWIECWRECKIVDADDQKSGPLFRTQWPAFFLTNESSKSFKIP